MFRIAPLGLRVQFSRKAKGEFFFFFEVWSTRELNMWHHQRYFKANHRGIQLEPVFLLAHTHIFTFTLNGIRFWSHRLSLKTVKMNLLCFLYKSFTAFYLMWQFLVKLVEYVNPSKRNALSHLALCLECVKIMGNEAWGHYCKNMPPSGVMETTISSTNLGIVVMIAQPRFTRFPTWTFDESWQLVADSLVSAGPSPQIQIIV